MNATIRTPTHTPNTRSHVADLIAKANTAGRKAGSFEAAWPAKRCQVCIDPKPRTDGHGNRIAYPCPGCGAVTG